MLANTLVLPSDATVFDSKGGGTYRPAIPPGGGSHSHKLYHFNDGYIPASAIVRVCIENQPYLAPAPNAALLLAEVIIDTYLFSVTSRLYVSKYDCVAVRR